MTKNLPTRNQEPEPVRPWFARLFRRPSKATDPTAPGALAIDPVLTLTRDLTAARAEAARWKEHADTYDAERAEASALSHHYRDELERAEKDRDGAYRERAQLLAWLAALHPSTTVITQSPDVDQDGWQLLYLVAAGWQMSWHIHPRDADLFGHVTVVDVTDPRAQWDGHGSEQKYERMRGHVRLLALDGLGADGPSTGVTEASPAARATALRHAIEAARTEGHRFDGEGKHERAAGAGAVTFALYQLLGETITGEREVRSA